MVKARKAWLAGILSFFAIGLGQIYSGKPKKGLFLFFIGQGITVVIVLSVIILIPNPILLLCTVLIALTFYIYNIIDAIISAKNAKEYKLKSYNKWYLYVLFYVVAIFVVQPVLTTSIKSNLVQAFKIPSGSMLPTIKVGDHIVAKTKYFVNKGLNHGDIVIFKWPEDSSINFIMRAIALGGDEIEIIDKKVYINGSITNEPYIINVDARSYKKRDNFGPVIVPDDSIFVLGDNRDNSNDSRFWGFVKNDSVIGLASSIYWSWDKTEMSVRWDRLGRVIK